MAEIRTDRFPVETSEQVHEMVKHLESLGIIVVEDTEGGHGYAPTALGRQAWQVLETHRQKSLEEYVQAAHSDFTSVLQEAAQELGITVTPIETDTPGLMGFDLSINQEESVPDGVNEHPA